MNAYDFIQGFYSGQYIPVWYAKTDHVQYVSIIYNSTGRESKKENNLRQRGCDRFFQTILFNNYQNYLNKNSFLQLAPLANSK